MKRNITPGRIEIPQAISTIPSTVILPHLPRKEIIDLINRIIIHEKKLPSLERFIISYLRKFLP